MTTATVFDSVAIFLIKEARVVEWDAGHEIVIIGSGVGGLTAAVAARAAGLETTVFEGSELWGGTSALSAGGVWVPDNHLMRADGVADSAEEAYAYLGNVIGDVGPASSPARRRAYVAAAPRMARELERLGFEWRRATRWPDCHTDLGGAKVGRMLKGNLFDTRRIGAAADTLRRPETIPPVPLQSGDIAALVLGVRSLRGMRAGAVTPGRAAGALARNRRLVCMGQAGGLLTDEHARVLREDGSVVDGLYAAGNTTASVLRLRYPGPGITLGASATFAYIAARHVADRVAVPA